MATHSSVLAWRILGTGEPGGLQSMGSHRVGHNWSDLAAAAARTLPRAAQVQVASNLPELRDTKILCQLLSCVLQTIPPQLSQSCKDCFSMWCSASHWACIFLLILKQAEMPLCQPLCRGKEQAPNYENSHTRSYYKNWMTVFRGPDFSSLIQDTGTKV